VQEANELVDFTVKAMTAQHMTKPGLTILEHPEDLGRVHSENPGSIWQLRSVQALSMIEGVVTGAIKQSDFGTSFPKPTRLLGRLPGLQQKVAAGWPTFDTNGWYTGPLAKQDGTATRLIGREGAEFATAATAAWPTLLWDCLANLTAEAYAQGCGTRGSPTGPEEQTSPPPKPKGPAATALTIGDDAAVAARVPIRRKITGEEFETLARGGSIGQGLCYVGRGGRGAAPSRWGNPFRVNAQCTREEATSKYKAYLAEAGLHDYIHELAGKDLLCHCKPEEPCHGDHLLELVRVAGSKSMGSFLDDGLPVRLLQGHQGPVASPQAGVTVGWHGAGPPRKARHMGGDKPFSDGGGLCSPGRWPPSKRRLPTALSGLRAFLVEQFEKAARKSSGDADDALAFMLKLAAGRVKTCPFREDGLEETRASMRAMLGMPVSEDVVATGQVFHLPLMAGLLRAFGDPDWSFVQGLGEGVPLGVDEDLPRTPAVFEEKGEMPPFGRCRPRKRLQRQLQIGCHSH
jgi:hypothetical protein